MHEILLLITKGISKGSDKPAHPHSLFKAFTAQVKRKMKNYDKTVIFLAQRAS